MNGDSSWSPGVLFPPGRPPCTHHPYLHHDIQAPYCVVTSPQPNTLSCALAEHCKTLCPHGGVGDTHHCVTVSCPLYEGPPASPVASFSTQLSLSLSPTVQVRGGASRWEEFSPGLRVILRARGRKRRPLSLLKDRRGSLGRGVEVKGFLGREHCVYFQKSLAFLN